MLKALNVQDIKYICQQMMGVDWLPSFICEPWWVANPKFKHEWEREEKKKWERHRDTILRILSQCQSKLEVMYLLGIAYYLHENANKHDGIAEDYPHFWDSEHEGQEGIHLSEPWHGYGCGYGPSALLVIPQWESPDKAIHHDFGLFTAPDNGGGPPWYFETAVEIEGYGIHKQRRKVDEKRYAGLSYQIISIYEETSNPCDWYKIIGDEEEDDHFLDVEAVQDRNKEPQFSPGDYVLHPIFGKGTVLSSGVDMSGDEWAKVQFNKERHPQPSMLMCRFAKMQKVILP